MTRQPFPKRLRLLRPAEFERVFAMRASASDAWLGMYGADNEFGYPRLGLTVSRRVGAAAARNRWKRLLREAFRLTQHQLPPLDLVCLPRAAAPPALCRLSESIHVLATRIQLQLDRRAEQRTGTIP